MRSPTIRAAMGACSVALCLIVDGCTSLQRGPQTEFTRDFLLPPEAAARCFARNAEAHSSALVADVMGSRDDYQVKVAVRNGTPYAHAAITSAGRRAKGTIRLNVQSSEGNRELVEALSEGC